MSARNGRYAACEECGKAFYLVWGREIQGRGKYCSKSCMAQGYKKRTGEKNHNFKGENHSFISNAYRRGGELKTLNYHIIRYTDANGLVKWRAEHVVIAEKVLGRRLKKGECVHHIDMNTLNNEPSNLMVCTNAYHKWLHNKYAQRFAELHLRTN